MLTSCKIAKQIKSFLNLLDGKISNRRLSVNVLSIIQGTSMMQLSKRRKELHKSMTEHDNLKLNLVSSTTWMKAQLMLFSVKRL